MNAFYRVRCSIPSPLEENLPHLLASVPLLGSEIGKSENDRIWITIYLEQTEVAAVSEIENLLSSQGGDDFESDLMDEEDWLAGYRDSVGPFAVGEKWWIDPHPDMPTPAPSGRYRLAIPPRTAFGSGSHESTRLILCSLETIEFQDINVFDLGTGSGILAFAADMLGARQVLAVDIDPISVRTARQISDIQEWETRVHFVTGSAGCAAVGTFQLVLCNMIAANFLPLLDAITGSLSSDGSLILSGLLDSEREEITKELLARGLRVKSTHSAGEWACLCAGWPS